jgi:hypothetical protein
MDFSKLRYNFTGSPKPVISQFPALGEVLAFSDESLDYLLRAVILITDDGSPFVSKERDYQKIVTAVFDYLNPKDRKTPKDLLSGLDTTDIQNMKDMMFQYFILLDNHAYAVWYAKMMDLYYMLDFLRSKPDIEKPDHFEKRVKVNKALPTLHKELADYESLIFPNELVKKVIKEQTIKALTFAERHAQPYGLT